MGVKPHEELLHQPEDTLALRQQIQLAVVVLPEGGNPQAGVGEQMICEVSSFTAQAEYLAGV